MSKETRDLKEEAHYMFDELWGRMQDGEDFYEIASVDGTGFDSAVRENIFSGMSDILDIPYDEIYETWLQNE